MCASCALFLFSFLDAREDHTGDILLALRDHRVGAAHREALLLKRLHHRQEHHGAALLVAVVLAKVDAPVRVLVGIRGAVGSRTGGIAVHEQKLGGLVGALGGHAGRRVLGEGLLKGIDGVLTEAGALDGDDGGVEGAGDDDVRHDDFGGFRWGR